MPSSVVNPPTFYVLTDPHLRVCKDSYSKNQIRNICRVFLYYYYNELHCKAVQYIGQILELDHLVSIDRYKSHIETKGEKVFVMIRIAIRSRKPLKAAKTLYQYLQTK